MKAMHPRKSGPGRYSQAESCERHEKPETAHLRDFSGAKIARKAENGVLSVRHSGGIVSQTFREMQQRNFKEAS